MYFRCISGVLKGVLKGVLGAGNPRLARAGGQAWLTDYGSLAHGLWEFGSRTMVVGPRRSFLMYIPLW